MFERLNDKSRMKREFHVRFRESLAGKFLGATRLSIPHAEKVSHKNLRSKGYGCSKESCSLDSGGDIETIPYGGNLCRIIFEAE